MALGAPRANVLALVLRDSCQLIALGLAAGLLAALAATRLATSQLYGLTASDPLTFAAATAVMALVALFAGYLPARRAADTDPMAALRHE
jgi:ABC-type antimicrobial peptide transport system permease subunit